jgi:pimeloyl-ACP methyl ester carboxylesterase
VSAAALEHVRSADGTRIAFRRIGAGPRIVVLHGALGTSLSWLAVARRLADRFELLLVDRRGRGGSGDGAPPHALGKEVDDARAVLSIAGPGASVVGHSFGGAVALELARRAEPGAIRRLMLYEPGVHVAGLIPAEQIDRIERLVGENRLEEALTAGTEHLAAAGLVRSDGPIAGRRPEFLALARTFPRELRAVDALGSDLSRYADVDFPTLLLVGGASPNRQQRNCAALARALPRVRVERLDRLGHVAHNAAPGRVADLTRAFLEAD